MNAVLRVVQLFCRLDPGAGGLLTYLESQEAALTGSDIELRTNAVSSSLLVAPHSPFGAWRLRRWLRQEIDAADVLHIHHLFGWHALLGLQASRVAGKPYVLTCHGAVYRNAMAPKALRKRLFMDWIGMRLLRDAAAILVTSDAEAELLRSLGAELKIELIAPGVAVPPQPMADLHRAIPRAGLQLLYLGRLHPHKDLPTAFAAVAQLIQRGLDIRLVLAGDGEPEHVAELRHLARKLGVHSQVVFSGHLSGADKLAALRAADLLVLPSRSENFSFAVAEALAQGVPAVISQEVGLASVVRRYDCGSIFPVGDAEALAGAVLALEPLERRRAAGLRAHRCAQRELSLPHMGRELQRVYHDRARGGAVAA